MIADFIIEPEEAAVELRPGGRLTLHGGPHLQPPIIHVRDVRSSDCLTRVSWVYGVDVRTGVAVAERVEVRAINL